MIIEDMKTSKTMNIRAIAILIIAMVFSLQANAVLKEENLDKTLAILKNELTTQYEEISTRTARQKARRGGFKTAHKLGRDWFISEMESNQDGRRKK